MFRGALGTCLADFISPQALVEYYEDFFNGVEPRSFGKNKSWKDGVTGSEDRTPWFMEDVRDFEVSRKSRERGVMRFTQLF